MEVDSFDSFENEFACEEDDHINYCQEFDYGTEQPNSHLSNSNYYTLTGQVMDEENDWPPNDYFPCQFSNIGYQCASVDSGYSCLAFDSRLDTGDNSEYHRDTRSDPWGYSSCFNTNSDTEYEYFSDAADNTASGSFPLEDNSRNCGTNQCNFSCPDTSGNSPGFNDNSETDYEYDPKSITSVSFARVFSRTNNIGSGANQCASSSISSHRNTANCLCGRKDPGNGNDELCSEYNPAATDEWSFFRNVANNDFIATTSNVRCGLRNPNESDSMSFGASSSHSLLRRANYAGRGTTYSVLSTDSSSICIGDEQFLDHNFPDRSAACSSSFDSTSVDSLATQFKVHEITDCGWRNVASHSDSIQGTDDEGYEETATKRRKVNHAEVIHFSEEAGGASDLHREEQEPENLKNIMLNPFAQQELLMEARARRRQMAWQMRKETNREDEEHESDEAASMQAYFARTQHLQQLHCEKSDGQNTRLAIGNEVCSQETCSDQYAPCRKIRNLFAANSNIQQLSAQEGNRTDPVDEAVVASTLQQKDDNFYKKAYDDLANAVCLLIEKEPFDHVDRDATQVREFYRDELIKTHGELIHPITRFSAPKSVNDVLRRDLENPAQDQGGSVQYAVRCKSHCSYCEIRGREAEHENQLQNVAQVNYQVNMGAQLRAEKDPRTFEKNVLCNNCEKFLDELLL